MFLCARNVKKKTNYMGYPTYSLTIRTDTLQSGLTGWKKPGRAARLQCLFLLVNVCALRILDFINDNYLTTLQSSFYR